MATSADYSITFGYKATDGYYYGPNGTVGKYHRGNDRPCPTGTSIVIGTVTIGLTGATGLVSGPHLHTQVCTAGSNYADDFNPSPYEFKYGTVIKAGWHSQFGNHIVIRVGNVDITYAHLSKINVAVGQELAPAALQPFQRTVGQNGVNERAAPSTSASITREFQPGEILDFKGWVTGGTYNGNNKWFVGRYSSKYFWTGAFTDTDTNGLQDLTPPVIAPPPPPLEPTPPPPISPPSYTFEKELPSVTEVILPDPTNYEIGNFPTRPTKVIIHDFGTLGVDTIGSVLNHYKNKDTTSPHFTVSKGRRIQNVSLKNRAYHAGPNGNNFVGIEADPAQDAETIASVNMILKDLDTYYGSPLERIKHSSVASTRCGDDINLDNYKPALAPPANDSQDIQKILTDVQWIKNKMEGIFK